MPKTATIPVRLPPEVVAKLDKLSAKHGMSRSALIKICLSSFLDKLDATPLSKATIEYFERQLTELDGRTHRYKRMDDAALERELKSALRRPEDKARARKRAG